MKIRFTKIQREEMLFALAYVSPHNSQFAEDLGVKLKDIRVQSQSLTLEEVEWLDKAARKVYKDRFPIVGKQWVGVMANLLQRLEVYRGKLETAAVKGKRFVWHGYAVEVLEAIRDGGRPDRKGYKVRSAGGRVHHVWDVEL